MSTQTRGLIKYLSLLESCNDCVRGDPWRITDIDNFCGNRLGMTQ